MIENNTSGHRDPEKFYFSIAGKPSRTGSWGYRVEEHHLSLNFTIQNGEVVSPSPAFFGANPHQVRLGPYQGLRALGKEEDLARILLNSLDPEQRRQAIVSKVSYPEILTQADA